MLASLLPGVREVRAPLAAGYLWLLCAWLLIGDPLPAKSGNEILARLRELDGLVSQVGVLVAVSAGAYLVGALVIAGSELFQVRQRRWRGRLLRRYMDRQQKRAERRLGDRARFLQPDRPFWAPPEKEDFDLDPWIAQNLRSWVRDQVPGDRMSSPAQQVPLDERHRRSTECKPVTETPDANLPPSDVDVDATEQTAESGPLFSGAPGSGGYSVYNTVLSEWERTKLLLTSKDPVLFAEIDRHDAEAAFRMAVAPPLAVLSVLAVMATGQWWWLAGIGGALGLLADGRRLRRRSRNALAEAIMSDTVTPPHIAALRRTQARQESQEPIVAGATPIATAPRR